MYTTQIWMIKVSMCTFYLRLTVGILLLAHWLASAHRPKAGLEGYKIRILVGLGIIVASYIAAIFIILFTCMPFEKHWQIYPDPGSTNPPQLIDQYTWTNGRIRQIYVCLLLIESSSIRALLSIFSATSIFS